MSIPDKHQPADATTANSNFTVLPAEYRPLTPEQYQAAVEALAELLRPVIRQVAEESSAT